MSEGYEGEIEALDKLIMNYFQAGWNIYDTSPAIQKFFRESLERREKIIRELEQENRELRERLDLLDRKVSLVSLGGLEGDIDE